MGNIGFAGTPDDEVEVTQADTADHVVAGSLVVGELLRRAPWLGNGPAGTQCEQHWIATGRPPWATQGSGIPNPAEFVPVVTLDDVEAIRRPLAAGLSTSSASQQHPGMWDAFIQLNATRELWRKPWATWRLRAPGDVKIGAASNACSWVALVERHHLRVGQHVYPDWKSMAEEFDAIHFSPAAICAIEGLAIESRHGLIAPAYFSVESTIWLRWCFTSTKLLGVDAETDRR
jgi:hypothetical protein